jgi:hypothetical protein
MGTSDTSRWSFAGIVDADALAPFGVEGNAAALRRFAFVERRLVQALAGWLPAAPEMEAKYAFGRHLWEDAEHAELLRRRVRQLRTGERALEAAPSHRLGLLMDELVYADDTAEFVAGAYGVAKAELLAAYRRHMAETQPLVDQPTLRILRIIVAEEQEQIAWGQEALDHLAGEPAALRRVEAWRGHLRAFLGGAGGVAGREPAPEGDVPVGRAATRPRYEIPREVAREPAFRATPGRFAPGERPEEWPPLHAMARARWYEMQAAEGLAMSIYEHGEAMPWEFSYDLARHCWDEVRHCMFGRVFMRQLGLNERDAPMMVGNGNFNRRLSPYERYVRLGIMIEQAAMAKTGKRREYELCREQGNALAAQFQDYDWADEVLHAQLARKWTAQMAEEEDTPVEEAIAGISEKYAAFIAPWVERGYRF